MTKTMGNDGERIYKIQVEITGKRKFKLPEPVKSAKDVVVFRGSTLELHGFNFRIEDNVLTWDNNIHPLSAGDILTFLYE